MVIHDIIINTIIILLLYNTYDLLVVTNLPKLSSIQYHSSIDYGLDQIYIFRDQLHFILSCFNV